MGGRVGFILGPLGLLMVGILLFLAIARWSRARSMGGSGNSDPLGLEPDDAGSGGGKPGLKTILPDFQTFLDRVARPRRLAQPDWERLDGAVGVPGRAIASFERNGMVYAVNGETSFAAFEAVADWMLSNPGQDAFVTLPGRKGAGRLGARPEIGWTDQKALKIETN